MTTTSPPRHRPSRRTAHLVGLCLLALLLAGCRLDVVATVDLAGDGGGELRLRVAADAELAQQAEAAGVDPLGRMADRVGALEGWGVDVEEGDDGARVVELRSRFADPAAFDQRWAALTGALDAPELRLLGPLSISVDDEAGTVSAEGALAYEVREVAAADLGMDAAALTAALAEATDVALVIRTPGTPLEADGTVVLDDPEAGTGPAAVTWAVEPGAQVGVSLVAEQGGSDLLVVVLLAGAAVLAVVLVGAGVWAQRRQARPARRRAPARPVR